MLVSLVVAVILAVIALAGWLRAWQLGRGPKTKSAQAAGPSRIDEVEQRAADQLADSIQQAAELFQRNLTVQALKINDELESLAGRRLRKQVEDFGATLDGLTTKASASVAQLESLIDARRKQMEASLTTEVTDEKQRTLERFYGRLSDIVASYIIQSLGNEVDLSGQLPFVVKVLEENKQLIKQDLSGDY